MMESLARIVESEDIHPRTVKWVEKAVTSSFNAERAAVGFERFFESVLEKDGTLLTHLNKRNIPWIGTLFSGSQALTDAAIKNPEWLFWALQPAVLHSTRFKRDMRREREAMLRAYKDPKEALGLFKNRELMRIGWRDLLKWADTVETVEDLSRLADVTIEGATLAAEKLMTERFGKPMHPNGKKAQFIVIGMGKLGGRELNFSSDIDLIYFYDNDEGETEGGSGPAGKERTRITIQEFYSRMAQQITSILGEIGPYGTIYRVDLGLRPGGNRGAVICSLPSAELYYESWGQPWEKQAMIKARVCVGDEELGDKFLETMRPFVYRRSLDFSALRDIQVMKDKIDKHLKTGKDKFKNNVKLGKGGIREIEFLIQAYQLIYGGKMPWLAETNSFKALHRIFERGLMGYSTYAMLADGLLFHRDLENRMQITYGRQVQIIPEGQEREALALKMGLPNADALMAEYERVTNNVNDIFRDFFKEEAEEIAEKRSEFSIDLDNREEAAAQLAKMKFEEPGVVLSSLLHIRDGEAFSHTTLKARRLFAGLLPEMLRVITPMPGKDRAIRNLDKFFSAIQQRESLYQLLTDYEPARDVLINVFTYAQNLADAMINQPDVIEILGSGATTMQGQSFGAIPSVIDTYDKKLDWIRKERNTESLRIGIEYLMSHSNPFTLMSRLSLLADTFTERCLEVIEDELLKQEEVALGIDETADKALKFAVIGLGKLGRRELNYGSDLDLMFVYSEKQILPGTLDNRSYFTKVCRRLLNAVGGISRYGLVYRVDTRLRPEGEQGPIVITDDAARLYYKKRGALWERMALSGARPVAGNIAFGREFLKSLDGYIYGAGFTDKDDELMRKMKGKIEKEKIKNYKKISIKYGSGGIVDIEFLAQKLKLAHGAAARHIRDYNTLEMLEAVEMEGWGVDDPAALIDAYKLLRVVETHIRMETGRGAETLPDKAENLRSLERTLAPFLALKEPLGDAVIHAMERARKSLAVCAIADKALRRDGAL
ncbi:MAG: DUF294 nucleotidyltransferase-like domain-containing protein [Nitrospinota bacterium]